MVRKPSTRFRRHQCVCVLLAIGAAWLGHAGWFAWRLAAGKIHVDAVDMSGLRLYFAVGAAWEGLALAILAGAAAYLGVREWLGLKCRPR